jgi:hypothetical protein
MKTNIELAVLQDGGVMLVSDSPLPDVVKRVEFYRDENICNLVYHDEAANSEMLPYNVPEDMIDALETAPQVMIYSLFTNHEPIGYKAPLVKVGIPL